MWFFRKSNVFGGLIREIVYKYKFMWMLFSSKDTISQEKKNCQLGGVILSRFDEVWFYLYIPRLIFEPDSSSNLN